MKREYRKIVENFELTYEESKTLAKAEDILQEMYDDLTMNECAFDDDLLEVIGNALKTLGRCNPRLNVNIILENGEKKE